MLGTRLLFVLNHYKTDLPATRYENTDSLIALQASVSPHTVKERFLPQTSRFFRFRRQPRSCGSWSRQVLAFAEYWRTMSSLLHKQYLFVLTALPCGGAEEETASCVCPGVIASQSGTLAHSSTKPCRDSCAV